MKKYNSNINFITESYNETVSSAKKILDYRKSPVLLKCFVVVFFFLSVIKNLEYKKNKNIKVSEKLEHGRVLEIEDESIIINKINLKKSNFLLVYYAEWCNHWYLLFPYFYIFKIKNF